MNLPVVTVSWHETKDFSECRIYPLDIWPMPGHHLLVPVLPKEPEAVIVALRNLWATEGLKERNKKT